MIPITRKELYLNKIVGNNDYDIPEKPITEEEFFFAEILGEAVQAPEPLTRYQIYLAKIAGRDIEIPYPETRLEFFLARAAGMDIETPTPITKEEIFWSNYTAIVEFEVEGEPPLTYKAIEGALKNYRIYGNTSKNILPLSKTPKTETIGDILCEYDGKGTFTFTSNVDNPTYTQGQWFWVPFEEDFDFPVGISDGGRGCIQLNNDFATEYGVNPYFVSFANRDNGEFVSGFGIAGTRLNNIDYNYDVEDLEGLPANCIVFQQLQSIGKRTVTIKPALYLDIRTQQPFEPYGESVGDLVTSGEHAGEYKVPVTVSNGTDTLTTPIYLPEQIRKVGDEAEYIDYGEQKQYVETTDGREKYVVGLNVDFENKTFTRLADAVSLSKGADFDNFSAFGGRRRCNVADNGTITAYYGDANYTEDGSNGQVMVYQPAFYYKVEPLKIEAQESGVGYHLRNANYYISNHQGTGFKLHPAFYNEAGDRVDYILLGAYEGCIYDTSANAYITNDSQVMNTSEDKFSSIANVKPASGQTQNLTRPNLETICKNRGDGWHSLDVRIASMEQLLMIIELGTMNTQTGAGSDGIVSISDDSSYNCASLTGSTGSLGNASGQASSTISDKGGMQTVETANGKTAYSFRGVENFWGNIWKFVYGVNIWGDGTMHGGVPYICKDYNFAESKRTDNYESAGFTLADASGYINALGYGDPDFDWLMMPSEIGGNSSLPVGDYNYVTANLNGYRIAQLGGYWYSGDSAGGFCWYCNNGVGFRYRHIGGRLVYVPQIEKQHIYYTDLDVTLPALPTVTGTNVLSVGTEVQPSNVYIKYEGVRGE